jgi:hypothetical protein
MMHTKVTLLQEPVGQIVPKLRDRADVNVVAEPAVDGLIRGRMDWERPVLFVSAVSYLGLRRATELATSVHDAASAARWGAWADELQGAWNTGYLEHRWSNERAFISGIHPSFVARERRRDFERDLETKWTSTEQILAGSAPWSPWSYFTAAQMHQWVLLDRPERAWRMLNYFFDHQTSPGLYTWAEGAGEENTFGLWEDVRGWISPKAVTPHYWTAAEVLLAQLSMLAYVDETFEEPTWVIGPGVPDEWLRTSFSVRHLRTTRGELNFAWDGHQLHVDIYAPEAKVRAGKAFPPGVLRVDFHERSE